ncbi:heavy metal-binding domain-containing protein [Hymenobacter glacieicola]|uniref:Heavy metal binding domain-containing protein n=1 Tax=Hymenobacter glacieicola TaxID=1562124 RepID=A0ABQ1WN45_9BACT|nr:heavy metal-binding domain-containing protein [Hymenobacter glacieicola]GGG39121.1 hypothetical protein GCM10011378_14260 [Hymenobacter glacieicola]
MMSFWKSTVTAVLLTAGALLASCQSKPAEQAAATAAPNPAPTDSTALPVATAAYLCPMGCEGSASDKPGKCPVCEMQLEPNPAATPTKAL